MALTVARLGVLALRNAWRFRSRTLLVGSIVALANAALVFQLAQGAGQRRAFEDAMVRTVTGHVQLTASDAGRDVAAADADGFAPLPEPARLLELLAAQPGIAAVTPRVRAGALGSVRDETWGAFLLGVAAERELTVATGLHLASGRFVAPGAAEVVIGESLARDKKLALGDDIAFLASTVDGSFGAVELEIVGLTDDRGIGRFYSSLAYVPIEKVRHLLGLEPDAVHEIVATLETPDQLDTVTAALGPQLGTGMRLTTWRDSGRLFQNILRIGDLFRLVMGLILALLAVVLVASTLGLYVLEREGEIAVMRALGFGTRDVLGTIVGEGVLLAGLSSLAGLLVGGGVSLWLGKVGIPAFTEALLYVFAGPRLYPRLELQTVGLLLAASVVLGVLAAAGPAWRAAHLDAPEVLGRQSP
ncbi:MAG: FtsX-like permease family protein [Thermoanaerobaculia bacterium]|nr:FtsX-like permease family protein [Thermoanaerobaculia bacterium]